MIRPIIEWPLAGQLLHTVSAPVDLTGGMGLVDELVRDMFDTLYDSGGVGLAAIQVSVPMRVFVMDVYKIAYTFINPTIALQGEVAQMTEGCLSIPGVLESMKRNTKVFVTALDCKGMLFSHTFSGMEAQCIQHEMDHLNGIVIPDSFSPLERTRMASRITRRRKAVDKP